MLHALGRDMAKDYLVIDLESFTRSPNGRSAPGLRVERVAAHECVAQFPARMSSTKNQTELCHELQMDSQTSLDCDGQPSAEPNGAAGEPVVERRGPREEFAGQDVAP